MSKDQSQSAVEILKRLDEISAYYDNRLDDVV
jgi:hypothetical protein